MPGGRPVPWEPRSHTAPSGAAVSADGDLGNLGGEVGSPEGEPGLLPGAL